MTIISQRDANRAQSLRYGPAASQQDAEDLATAILTRRRLKCIAQGTHTTTGCARCGQ
jgi:hypothetical protein